MKLAVLASATEASLQAEHEEGQRMARLTQHLRQLGVTVDVALNLIGQHDYLFVLDVPGAVTQAFAVASAMIGAGGMRTQTFIGIGVQEYARIAGRPADEATP
jgi:uncharacterized protein with GYD domain